MKQKELRLHILDVGHGDSIIIEFPDGVSYGIVDCNLHQPSNRGFGLDFDKKEPKALCFFARITDTGRNPNIAFVCLTHPHIDHYRGFARLLDGLRELNIPIREYWDFGLSREKALALYDLAVDDYLAEVAKEFYQLQETRLLLSRQGTSLRHLNTPAERFWAGQEVTIDVLAPFTEQYEKYSVYNSCSPRDKQRFLRNVRAKGCSFDSTLPCSCPADDNIVSSCLLLKYGNFRALLGADLPNCSWRGVIARSKPSPRSHVLKVSHHGSLEGNFPSKTKPLWPFVSIPDSPLITVISGGYRQNLPHGRIIDSLHDSKCRVYCTGPAITLGFNRYRPSDASNELLDSHLKHILFVEKQPENQTQENSETWSGRGDICIVGSYDGSAEVRTEFPLGRRVGRQIL